MSTTKGILALSAGALLTFAAAQALASAGGGGGGGGFSAPSASAPLYNPVEEYKRGTQALQDGKYRDAERNFNHVLDVAPKDPSTLYMMGVAKTGEKDLKGARSYFEKSTKADPNLIAARRQLALTEAALGDKAKAQADLDLLKTKQAACGATCPQSADLTAAVTEIAAALTPAPAAGAAAPPAGGSASIDHSGLLFTPAEGDHAYVQAVRLINNHRYKEALAELKQAQTAFGPHPDILTYIGYVSRKLGRLDEAETYYKQVFDIAPDHVGATEYYGELKVERGDMAGAKLLLAKLDRVCTYGCIEQDDLRRWIVAGREP